jgi:hypothetical protein
MKAAIELLLYIVLAASLVFGVLFTLAFFPLHLMVGWVNRFVDWALADRASPSSSLE